MLSELFAAHLNQCLMINIPSSEINWWYDSLNDAYDHQLPFYLIAFYLDAINEYELTETNV